MKRIQYGKPQKCRKTQKTIFHDEKSASRAMFRVWSRDPSVDMRDMHTYSCEDCKMWHFGHISYYQKTLERQTNVQA